MNNNYLTLLGTALIASLVASPTYAANQKAIVDFARVTRVEPVYRYVTVQEPQRQCEYVRPAREQRRNHNRRHNNNQQRRFISGDSITGSNTGTRNNTGSAVVIGGVIGGAIGHQLSETINGRSDPAITLTGAAIGSVLAHSVARNTTNNSNRRTTSHASYTNHITNVESLRSHQSPNSHQSNSRHAGNNQNGRLVERCVTTTVSRQERRHDGYNVTYVYRGNTFQTRTDQHPGDRIRVRVQVRPH